MRRYSARSALSGKLFKLVLNNDVYMSLGADSENWRAISGYPAYQVSDLGRVRSTEDLRILNLNANKRGYRQITLYHNKKGKIILSIGW